MIIRHGQSEWNQHNRFTGWADIDLSSQGIKEAKRAAKLLIDLGFKYDIACTSVLRRAIRTLWILLDEMNQMWTPVIKSWRLNERHYGELTGSNKLKMIEKYGKKQVQIWRRSYQTPPPQNLTHELTSSTLPHLVPPFLKKIEPLQGESLKQTQNRVLPFWNEIIAPALQNKENLLVVAHGNSLRALIKHIEQLNEHEITEVEIPTGVPMAYHLSSKDLSIQTPRVVIQ